MWIFLVMHIYMRVCIQIHLSGRRSRRRVYMRGFSVASTHESFLLYLLHSSRALRQVFPATGGATEPPPPLSFLGDRLLRPSPSSASFSAASPSPRAGVDDPHSAGDVATSAALDDARCVRLHRWRGGAGAPATSTTAAI
jgi:hypothetical protein